MYSMPSTPLICCSMGDATESTTVSQSAPGKVVEILISAGTISGYCATGKDSAVINPPNTNMSATHIATTGRLMKNAYIKAFDSPLPPADSKTGRIGCTLGTKHRLPADNNAETKIYLTCATCFFRMKRSLCHLASTHPNTVPAYKPCCMSTSK